MLADDFACDPRNSHRAQIFNDRSHNVNIYDEHVKVDYRGEAVTAQNLIRTLTGRHVDGTLLSQRLDTGPKSNIFLYLTGHGGDGFLKFQDTLEISASDLSDAIKEMWEKKRYHEMFVMVETCQAATMVENIDAPNVISIASSRRGENSYSYYNDNDLGVTLVDRFTYQTMRFFESVHIRSDGSSLETLQQLFDSYDPRFLHSNTVVRSHGFARKPSAVPVTDFFGSVSQVAPVRLQSIETRGSLFSTQLPRKNKMPPAPHRILRPPMEVPENQKRPAISEAGLSIFGAILISISAIAIAARPA